MTSKLFDVSNIWRQTVFGDRYIDVSVGRHFTLVVSMSGKVYGTGSKFYSRIAESRQSEVNTSGSHPNNENNPYEVKLPQGYTAMNVYCSTKHYVAFVAAKKDGKKVMLSCGDEMALLG